MTKRLSQAERNKIIYDYINGVPNEEYEVRKTKSDKYMVRKRKSPFNPQQETIHIEAQTQQTQPMNEITPTPEEKLNRISNEELLSKLSTLLELKEQEQSSEEDEYIDTAPAPTIQEMQKPDSYMYQQQIQQYTYKQPPQYQPPQQINRYSRKKLSLF